MFVSTSNRNEEAPSHLKSPDNLHLSTHKTIKKHLKRIGCNTVIWSDYVDLFMEDNSRSTYAIVITEGHVLILTCVRYKMLSEIKVEDVKTLVYQREKSSEGIVGLITNDATMAMYLNKKFEFFEHFLSERKKHSTPFEIAAVEDVKACCLQKSKKDKPATIVPLPESQNLFWYAPCEQDYAQVIGKSGICNWLIKYEDMEVVFSDMVMKINAKGKRMQRILIITDSAIYICNNKNYTLNRRILMQDIKALRIDTENIGEFAIVVPSEYDVYLKSEKLLEILQCLKCNEDASHIEFEEKTQISNGLNLAVTQEYKQKLKKLHEPEYIREQLKQALAKQDAKNLRFSVELARVRCLEKDPAYIEAQKLVDELNKGRIISKMWDLNYAKYNIKELEDLLQKAKELKCMEQFVQEKQPLYQQIVTMEQLRVWILQNINKGDHSANEDLVNKLKEEQVARVHKFMSHNIHQAAKFSDYGALRAALTVSKTLKMENSDAYKFGQEALQQIEECKQPREFALPDKPERFFIRLSKQGLPEYRSQSVIKCTVDAFDNLGFHMYQTNINFSAIEDGILKIENLRSKCRSQQTHFVFSLQISNAEEEILCASIVDDQQEEKFKYLLHLNKFDINNYILCVLSRIKKGSEKWSMLACGKPISGTGVNDIRKALGIPAPPKTVVFQALEGRDLAPKDWNGYSDPYVRVEYEDQKYKSNHIYKTLNPKWKNQQHKFVIGEKPSTFVITCWDYDKMSSDDFMGQINLPLVDIQPTEKWYELHPNQEQYPDQKVSGALKLKFEFEFEELV